MLILYLASLCALALGSPLEVPVVTPVVTPVVKVPVVKVPVVPDVKVPVVPDVKVPVVHDVKVPVVPVDKVPAFPIPVEKIPVIPVDEHHPATTFTKTVVPFVDTQEKGFLDTAKVFTTGLYRLQTFERTYMANPFPVDEHFRLVFDSMVKLGIERTQLENLRRRVFFNLESAQKASFQHSYEVTTLIDLVESVVFAVKNNVTSKEFFSRRKVAIEEVASFLREELSDIRVKIALGLNSYTDTIKALTGSYTTPESSIVKRHMKFVLFVYDLGHEELDEIIAALEEECKQFLMDYEKFINDIVAAVDDLVTPEA